MKHKNKPKDEREKSSKFRLTRTLIISVLTPSAFIILFFSWVAQNYYQSTWRDKNDHLIMTQLLIQIEQVNAQQWQIEFASQVNRQPMNPESYCMAAYNLISSVATLMAWETARTLTSDSQDIPIQEKNISLEVAKERLENADWKFLSKMANEAIIIKNVYQRDLDRKFADLLSKAERNAAIWNKKFLIFYIIGSLVLALKWVLVDFFEWR